MADFGLIETSKNITHRNKRAYTKEIQDSFSCFASRNIKQSGPNCYVAAGINIVFKHRSLFSRLTRKLQNHLTKVNDSEGFTKEDTYEIFPKEVREIYALLQPDGPLEEVFHKRGGDPLKLIISYLQANNLIRKDALRFLKYHVYHCTDIGPKKYNVNSFTFDQKCQVGDIKTNDGKPSVISSNIVKFITSKLEIFRTKEFVLFEFRFGESDQDNVQNVSHRGGRMPEFGIPIEKFEKKILLPVILNLSKGPEMMQPIVSGGIRTKRKGEYDKIHGHSLSFNVCYENKTFLRSNSMQTETKILFCNSQKAHEKCGALKDISDHQKVISLILLCDSRMINPTTSDI